MLGGIPGRKWVQRVQAAIGPAGPGRPGFGPESALPFGLVQKVVIKAHSMEAGWCLRCQFIYNAPDRAPPQPSGQRPVKPSNPPAKGRFILRNLSAPLGR